MRPLGPLFDPELSDDEARMLYRSRKADGTLEEAMFMAQREMAIQLGRQNRTFEQLARTTNEHLDQHPANAAVSAHLKDAHDAAVTAKFVKRAVGYGTAGLGLVISFWGVVIATLVLVAM